jgi:hypothetical protein
MKYEEMIAKIEKDANGTLFSRCVDALVGSRLVTSLFLAASVFAIAWRNCEWWADSEILYRTIQWVQGDTDAPHDRALVRRRYLVDRL